MGALPGTAPTGPALKAASVAGGPEVSAAAKVAQQRRAASKRPGQTRAQARAAGVPQGDPSIQGEPATPPPPTSPPPASPGGGAGPSIAMPAAAATGSGFLLGVFAWAVGLAYLRGGSAGVRQFFAAKFFNHTTAPAATGPTVAAGMPFAPAASGSAIAGAHAGAQINPSTGQVVGFGY